MKTVFEKIVAYSPRAASLAFDPPCGERAIRAALRAGELSAHLVGNRKYILRDDLIRFVASCKETRQ